MENTWNNGGKQNPDELDKMKAVSVKLAEAVGSAGLLYFGAKIASKGSEVWENVSRISSPSDDVGTKLVDTLGLGTGAVIMGAGVALAAAGGYVAYKVAKDNHLKTKFLRAAVKVKNSKAGQMTAKFVETARKQVAKGQDAYVDGKYQSTLVDVENGTDKEYVRQYPKVAAEKIGIAAQKTGNFFSRMMKPKGR